MAKKKSRTALDKLKTAYDFLNDNYFDGKIKCQIKFDKIKDDGVSDFSSKDGKKIIKITNDFKTHPDAAAIVLLHEMVHVKLMSEGYIDLHKGHGLRFHAEIDRLYKQGAYGELL